MLRTMAMMPMADLLSTSQEKYVALGWVAGWQDTQNQRGPTPRPRPEYPKTVHQGSGRLILQVLARLRALWGQHAYLYALCPLYDIMTARGHYQHYIWQFDHDRHPQKHETLWNIVEHCEEIEPKYEIFNFFRAITVNTAISPKFN